MGKVKIPESEYDKIVDMYLNGLTHKEISDKYGVSDVTIGNILKRRNIKSKNRTYKLNKEDHQKIVTLYQDSISINDIASRFNISNNYVREILNNHGIKTPNSKYFNFTYDDVAKMYNMYVSGLSSCDIAKIYNIHSTSVINWFKKYEFEIKNSSYAHQQYKINESYFDIIDTPHKAYYLGLLYADGNNMPDRHAIRISLQERDVHILEKMKDDLEYSGPLRFIDYNSKNKNHQNQWCLDITNKHMSYALEKNGVCKNKSLVLTWPEHLEEHLYSHFIRGYFDGDGCLYFANDNHCVEVSFIGTEIFLTKLSDVVKEYLNIDMYIRSFNAKYNSAIRGARISSKNGVKSFLEWIYKDANLMLNRKYNKYQQFLNNINNSYCA